MRHAWSETYHLRARKTALQIAGPHLIVDGNA